MSQVMYTAAEVEKLISAEKNLLIAGDENILKGLPKGNWIGGTIPYFMSSEGGVHTADKLLVTEIPDYALSSKIKVYSVDTISSIYQDASDNSLTFVLVPAMSKTHLEYAVNAPDYEDFAQQPVVGWITGVDLKDFGSVAPKVFSGNTGEVLEEGAVAMQVTLPPTKIASVGIINIFEQGNGDVITFANDGFNVTEACINGQPRNFAEYLTSINADPKLPLVADYNGAMINVSFQSVDADKGEVALYAPVFSGVEYKLAAPITDYVKQFSAMIPEPGGEVIAFSCNCLLNYLYAELEGKQTGPFVGPITFGEVAYQLLNQTLVYVSIYDQPV